MRNHNPLDIIEHILGAVEDWLHERKMILFISALMVPLLAFGMLVAFQALPPQTADATPVHHQATPSASCDTGKSNDFGFGVRECKVPLKDGRTVTCVNIVKGTPCDWDHATTRKVK